MKSTNFVKKLREEEATFISETENIRKLTAKDAMIKPVFIYPEYNADRIIKKLKREEKNIVNI